MVFDAMARSLGWDVVHVCPNHEYKMNDTIADEVWYKYYNPVLMVESIECIIIGDITITAGYPFLRHLHDIPQHIPIILQVTNAFYYGNDDNTSILDAFKSIINSTQRVHIVYVDQFIKKTLQEYDLHANKKPGAFTYIPLSGISSTNTKMRFPYHMCPELVSASSTECIYTYSPQHPFYYEPSVLPVPSYDIAWVERTHIVSHMYRQIYKYQELFFDGIPNGKYGGPEGISVYNTIVYIPYHYSTVSFGEFLTLGIKCIVPSRAFFDTHIKHYVTHVPLIVELMDVYTGPLSHLVVEFDSFHHLHNLLYQRHSMSREEKQRERMEQAAFMQTFNASVFQQWDKLVDEVVKAHN